MKQECEIKQGLLETHRTQTTLQEPPRHKAPYRKASHHHSYWRADTSSSARDTQHTHESDGDGGGQARACCRVGESGGEGGGGRREGEMGGGAPNGVRDEPPSVGRTGPKDKACATSPVPGKVRRGRIPPSLLRPHHHGITSRSDHIPWAVSCAEIPSSSHLPCPPVGLGDFLSASLRSRQRGEEFSPLRSQKAAHLASTFRRALRHSEHGAKSFCTCYRLAKASKIN